MLRTFLFLSLVLLTTAAAPADAQDKKGDPGAEVGRFRPKRFTGTLAPYDLNKEYTENKEKRDAGKPWEFSYILVKEFNDESYPGVEFRWHETSDTFDHIGIREKDKDTVQTVFLGWWSSKNDVQNWGFFHGELERTTRADRFAIIPKAEVAVAIKKSLLDRKLIGGEKDITDVFRYRERMFETDLKDTKITFRTAKYGPVVYGVSVGGKLSLFTEAGREAADGSVALIDIQDKNAIRKGEPGAELVRFRPKRFAGPLTPYDLNKEYTENKKKSDARLFSIYTYFIVKEFNDHYYPGVEFSWHNAGEYFYHVGVREERDTVRTVFLSWVSLSGVHWGFSHGELERTTRADRFAIIPKAEVAAAIKKSLLDRKLIGGEKDITDVFRFRAQKFETDLKFSGIKFPKVEFGPVKYGVSVGGRVYLFTEAGEEADRSVALIDVQAPDESAAGWERSRPKRFTGKLEPYDQNKDFIVKGFNDHYYPGVKFRWHVTSDTRDYIGIREKDKDTVQEVHLGWSSLSEGLLWVIYHGELERTTRADRFAIIPKAEVAAAIKKSLLDRKLIGGEKDITDVFRYRSRKIETDSKNFGIKFPKVEFGPIKYGVSVGEEVYLFTETGEPTK